MAVKGLKVGSLNSSDDVSGMVKIVPTSVAVGSGTGSANTLGTVTFSGATTISLNGCFNSTYSNYKLVINFESFSGTDNIFYMRLRASGSDNTTSNYRYTGNDWASNWNPWSDALYSQDKFVVHRYSRANGIYMSMDVLNPFATKYTGWLSLSSQVATNPGVNHAAGIFNATTSFDGFTMFPEVSQNMSGTISVYGYTN